jgi:hypothetical protein
MILRLDGLETDDTYNEWIITQNTPIVIRKATNSNKIAITIPGNKKSTIEFKNAEYANKALRLFDLATQYNEKELKELYPELFV